MYKAGQIITMNHTRWKITPTSKDVCEECRASNGMCPVEQDEFDAETCCNLPKKGNMLCYPKKLE